MESSHLVKFKTPFGKFGMGEARNFKFGIRIYLDKFNLSVGKYLKRGVVRIQGPNF